MLAIWSTRSVHSYLAVYLVVELVQDDPGRLAEVLVAFWRRNERVVVGVKKVGES